MPNDKEIVQEAIHDVVETAFNASVPNCCPACERDISYGGDPVGVITDAVVGYLMESFEVWVTQKAFDINEN